jgi:hypothetical protein
VATIKQVIRNVRISKSRGYLKYTNFLMELWMNETLAERRYQNLKFIGVPWITVEETFYRSSPHTSAPITPLRRSVADLPRLSPDEPTRSYFPQSSTLFTKAEYRQLQESMYHTDDRPGVLRRSPSRLQQIQESHPDLTLMQGSANNSQFIAVSEDEDCIPRCNSIVSLKSLSGECFQDLSEQSDTPKLNGIPSTFQAIPMQEDLRPRIWNHCHDQSRKGHHRAKVHLFEESGDTLTGPRARLPRTSALYSRIQKDRKELLSRPRPKEFAELNDAKAVELDSSFGAWRYRKWIDKTTSPVPDFLTGVAFQGVKKQHMRSKTGPPSRAGRRS